jgi:hypothetical protein
VSKRRRRQVPDIRCALLTILNYFIIGFASFFKKSKEFFLWTNEPSYLNWNIYAVIIKQNSKYLMTWKVIHDKYWGEQLEKPGAQQL